MGCGCKTNSKTNIGNESKITTDNGDEVFIEGFSEESKKRHRTKKNFRYVVNFMFFLFSLLFLPLIMIGVIIILFNFFVFNDNIDTAKIVKILAHKIKFANYTDEELNYIYGEKPEDDDFEYKDLYEIEDINVE